MERLVARLVQEGLLELVPGETVGAVTDEVLAAMVQRTRHAQVGAFVSGVLVASHRVEELYADDKTIARLLSDLG